MRLLLLLSLAIFGCIGNQCPTDGTPVCAEGVTYPNECLAKSSGVIDYEMGECFNCVDGDGGKDLFTEGTTKSNDEIRTDTCDDGEVIEYFCFEKSVESQKFPCPSGYECKNGKCIESQCTDSDNGENEKVAGKAVSGMDSKSDSCNGPYEVLEYYCDNGQISNKQIICDDNYECKNGACVVSQCSDSDGKDSAKKGTTKLGKETMEDSCINGAVKEYFCSSNEIKNEVIQCSAGYVCDAGACIKEVCKDSDNGKDTSKKGTTTLSGKTYTDSCYSDTRVMEYYCQTEIEIEYEQINCQTGYECYDGLCRKAACTENRDDISDENERYEIDSFSNDVRLHENDVLELSGDYILTVDDIGTDADFILYEDYEAYLDGDEICEFSISEGDNETDPCGENIDELTVADLGTNYLLLETDGFEIVQYFSTKGYESEWNGGSSCPEDALVVTSQTSYFYPYLETVSSGIDLSGEKINFLDDFAEIDEVDDDLIQIQFDGDDYSLKDGSSFKYGNSTYRVDLEFNDRGITMVKLTKN